MSPCKHHTYDYDYDYDLNDKIEGYIMHLKKKKKGLERGKQEDIEQDLASSFIL